MRSTLFAAVVGAVSLGAGTVAQCQPIPDVPPAVVIPRHPDSLPNGERPWPEIPETEVAKMLPAIPAAPQVAPKKPRKLLVFYRTDGYPHTSIPHWNKLLQLLGEKTGAYEATLSQSYADLQADRLKEFDAVFFNNTCRMVTPPEVKAALQAFVKGGKGFAGNHGAGDNWQDWAEGLDMLGAMFNRHPFGRIHVKVDDPTNPIAAVFGGKSFPYSDEIYAFQKPYGRDGVRVLLSIDYANSPEVQKAEEAFLKGGGEDANSMRPDHDYAISWVKPWGKGRVFYCSLGHRAEVTFDPAMIRFYLAGIQYAIGDLEADDAPLGGPRAAADKPLAAAVLDPGRPAAEPKPEIYDDLAFADGFEYVPFATPPMIHSPVCVSATLDGVVYVSSDANGSAGSKRGQGKIFRVVDRDDDGRADAATEFVPDIDAPRGLLAEGDTLYVMHPPHLTAFTDSDGDGKADTQRIVVKNLGWDLADRRADHGSNAIAMGIDGWLYVAIGDFGIMKAEGTDGRTVQLRGGGVVRVRPDGTGLEIYARGTRNIFELAISPLLDGFARDNSNDGGGWNVRFHHFSGLEDHGYPTLYKNFADECVAPVADYGGGSGCGIVWMGEPGWPRQWSSQPIDADWGKQGIYGHTLLPRGASFSEPVPPTDFVVLKPEVTRVNAFRPTDVDVDARGRMYLVSWKNGGFAAGPGVGFVFRVQPIGHAAPALPAFANLKPAELATLMMSPSHRTRLEAQRLLVAGGLDDDSRRVLETTAADAGRPLESRVAALCTLARAERERAFPALARLAGDRFIAAWAIRALADDERIASAAPLEPIKAGIASTDPRTRREAAVALARIGNPAHGGLIVSLLGDVDPLVRHTAVKALVKLGAVSACLAVFDDEAATATQREAAVQAIGRMHDQAAVDGLVARLARASDPARRRPLLAALCRLEQREGEWKGDSWGTVPDNRGPYYQPERWSGSDAVDAALVATIDVVTPDEAAWLAGELARNRVALQAAIDRMIARAEREPAIMPPLVAQLAQVPAVPAAAVPMLTSIATAPATSHDTRALAVKALATVDSQEAIQAILAAFVLPNGGNEYWPARFAFLAAPHLATHRKLLMDVAASTTGSAQFAEEGLMKIVANPATPAAARDEVTAALENGWDESDKRMRQIVAAARDTHTPNDFLARRIAPLVTSEDQGLAGTAKHYFELIKRKPEEFTAAAAKPAGPLVGTLPAEEAAAAAVGAAGDAARGEQLFAKLQCASCHTVAAGQPPKGPNLANAAAIYTRKELATAVLEPSKTIAQGFTTNLLMLEDGRVLTGFVTREAADAITVRDGKGEETTVKKEEIAQRQKLDGVSVMPAGLVAGITTEEFGALLTYLQSLKPAKP